MIINFGLCNQRNKKIRILKYKNIDKNLTFSYLFQFENNFKFAKTCFLLQYYKLVLPNRISISNCFLRFLLHEIFEKKIQQDVIYSIQDTSSLLFHSKLHHINIELDTNYQFICTRITYIKENENIYSNENETYS